MTATCLLITGPGHSATRLVAKMFARHPDVSVPLSALNDEAEFVPLHRFFIYTMDRTRLPEERYAIDTDELAFVLDAYRANLDASKPWFVLKLPFYPLISLPELSAYFGGRLRLLYTERPAEKIVRSFLERGEDRLFFIERPDEIFRQVKKMDGPERKAHLAALDGESFLRALVGRCDELRRAWDRTHPENSFLPVEVEKIASSREELATLLRRIGLDPDPAAAMLEVADLDRLHQKPVRDVPDSPSPAWRRLASACTPPVLKLAAKRLLGRG